MLVHTVAMVVRWVLAVWLASASCHRSPPTTSDAAVPVPPSESASPRAEGEVAPFLPNGCLPGAHDVRAWKRVDPTTVADAEHYALNNSSCTWSVTLRDGVPTAAEYREPPPVVLSSAFHLPKNLGAPRAVEHGRSGVLVGFNHGEWGGSLLWYAEDGATQRELLDDNVVEILRVEARFVVLAGLSHLDEDRGRAVELLDEGGGFKLGRQTELGSAPRASVREPDGGLLIATTKGLVRLTPEFQAHRLRDTHWGMFYPVSIVIDQGRTAYVGMRGIVVEVGLAGEPPTETWLYPP